MLAASLDRPAPPDHVWLQVAGRLRQEGRLAPRRSCRGPRAITTRFSRSPQRWSSPSARSLLVLLPPFANPRPHRAAPPATRRATRIRQDSVQGVEAEFRLAEQHYQAASPSSRSGKSDQDAIDPQTAAMLQKNLQVIDQAIAESRAALRTEPTSTPARDSLFDALKRKVSLLQDTIALMNEMRKGNAAGAAQLVDGTNKG